VLRRVDIVAKKSEFEAWLREVRRAEPRGKRETDELFLEFAEEWNLCTLPEKYYSLDKWEGEQQRGAAAAAARGGAPAGGGEYDMRNDLDARRREVELAAQRREQERLALLRATAAARQADPESRKREELLMQAQYAFNRGDVREQERLMKRVEENDKAAEAAKWR
jgi:hypothetical protein